MVDLKSRGPWHAVFDKETGVFFITEELCPLAGVNWDYASGYDEPSSWDWETARLMAAAPELLEAIEAAIASGMVPGESITSGPGTKTQQGKAAAMLRAAIAKAKGEE